MKDNFPKLPEVKFNKNGYEIRTEILAMAKEAVMEEYHMKFRGWEMSVAKDEKTGQVVTKVDMPEFPGMQHILDAAQQMYDFVNQVQGK
jgi:isocitrate dehydrogenase